MQPDRTRYRVLFLGKLPPPYIGPSVATQLILNSRLKDEFELIHLDLSDPRDIDTLGKIDFMNIYLALAQRLLPPRLFILFANWPVRPEKPFLAP